MTARGLIFAVVISLAGGLLVFALSGNQEDDGTPSSVIESVREEFPHTHTDDIRVSYEDIKEQDPDATDEEIAEWMKEAVRLDGEVEAWNECLEVNPTGAGCVEPRTELSDDNPLGW